MFNTYLENSLSALVCGIFYVKWFVGYIFFPPLCNTNVGVVQQVGLSILPKAPTVAALGPPNLLNSNPGP